MATKTRDDLVSRALNKLGVIGAGQTAATEDTAQVDGTVDSVMSDLATRQIFAWGDPDDIDQDAFEHLADCLAVANARDYGLQPDDNVRLMAESRLRQLNLTALSGQPQSVDYF